MLSPGLFAVTPGKRRAGANAAVWSLFHESAPAGGGAVVSSLERELSDTNEQLTAEARCHASLRYLANS